jgi:hypothetical protein
VSATKECPSASLRSVLLRWKRAELRVVGGRPPGGETPRTLPAAGEVAHVCAPPPHPHPPTPPHPNPRTLATNNAPNHLHGGDSGFSSRVWLVTASTPSSATFALTSEDGDQGYPGAVHCVVTYSLSDAALDISFDTRVLKGCAVAGLTNHSYWNLGGGEGGCLDHERAVFADGSAARARRGDGGRGRARGLSGGDPPTPPRGRRGRTWRGYVRLGGESGLLRSGVVGGRPPEPPPRPARSHMARLC